MNKQQVKCKESFGSEKSKIKPGGFFVRKNYMYIYSNKKYVKA